MHTLLRVFLVAVLGAGLLTLLQSPAAADPIVTVTVTIKRITLLAGGDCGDPDFYNRVWINGIYHDNEDSESQDDLEGNPDIAPDWEFSKPIDVATLTTPGHIPIKIEVHDEDGGLCFGGEHYDSSPTADRFFDGYIDLAGCSVHDPRQTDQPYLGGCRTPIVQAGTADERVRLTFELDAREPASAPGLNIRCTHTPVWPKPGEPVTIVATALDGELQPTIIADDLEIWVNLQASAASLAGDPLQSRRSVGTLTETFTPRADMAPFAYGCRLAKNGVNLFSSWHTVAVGDPFPNFTFPKPAVPISYTGPRSSRIDIVFVADKDEYDSPADPRFIADVAATIERSYWGLKEYLTRQDMFNFWLLPDNTGYASDASGDKDCDHGLPVLWDDAYGWAEAAAILHHRGAQQDCAQRSDRIFSVLVDPGKPRIAAHETAHQPFGLSDEYPEGGAFAQEVYPNVYEDYADCEDDAPLLQRTPAACRSWEKEHWYGDQDWWTSEPMPDDLMFDNGRAREADIRRFKYVFEGCEAAKC
ncbi:hypothetical protein [Acrocarpospora sp. B8E8]|uniref:hypothetical protein n=1 Tax=Acrocarpospora sp. B8E8 TaxID=3153572 RepID=UPI00325DAE65